MYNLIAAYYVCGGTSKHTARSDKEQHVFEMVYILLERLYTVRLCTRENHLHAPLPFVTVEVVYYNFNPHSLHDFDTIYFRLPLTRQRSLLIALSCTLQRRSFRFRLRTDANGTHPVICARYTVR